MAEGSRLPRKATGVERSNQSMWAVAFQVGTLVAIERNRKRLTQAELGKQVGLDQVAISRIENGDPLSDTGTDEKIDKLFKALGLGSGSVQANFVKWWRDNR
jgi:DNA-binding XRE family transcriptional regulator